MTDLNKLRDDLARKHHEKNAKLSGERSAVQNYNSFLFGWDECLSTLERAAGEFDEQALEIEYTRRHERNELRNFPAGARWQFEQDRARIGQFAMNSKLAIEDRNDALDKLAASEARVRELSQLLKDKGIR